MQSENETTTSTNKPARDARSFPVRVVRRIAVAVIGGTVILAGIAMLVLPGPGLLTIAGGLAILAVEFTWAKRWLKRAREAAEKTAHKASERVRRNRAR
jgi:uncharacterized protein (TIGR02611 family)